MPVEAVRGRDALRLRDDGAENLPANAAGWADWVSATATRNSCRADTLIDWLEVFGADKGFTPEEPEPDYDFAAFLFERGRAFERAVVADLAHRFAVERIAATNADARNEEAALRGWEAMRGGCEVIDQAVLWNPENQTYGICDLLVRSDVLARWIPGSLDAEQATTPAPAIPGSRWHYRAVDVKFTTLNLLRDGHVNNKHREFAAQLWLYNRALGRLQGWLPECAYLLGRGWSQGATRGDSALERLGRVDDAHAFRDESRLETLVAEACAWQRRLRREGGGWQALPRPSLEALRPNLRADSDPPWRHAKRQIAEALEDLTLLPRVNPATRRAALARGLQRWSDPTCSAAELGIGPRSAAERIDATLRANRSPADGPVVFPQHIRANETSWRVPAAAEFYVDFETVTDLADDFSHFPHRGGQPLISMIGCGHLEEPGDPRSWRFAMFGVERLEESEELRVIEAWLAHLRGLCAQRGADLSDARIFHWSDAEVSFLGGAYNSAASRHQQPDWQHLPWVDLLAEVVRAEPVSVRGAFGSGLKEIVEAMHAAGLIDTVWGDGPADGLGASVATWRSDWESRTSGRPMSDFAVMAEVARYNEVDCRVMAEILGFFRQQR